MRECIGTPLLARNVAIAPLSERGGNSVDTPHSFITVATSLLTRSRDNTLYGLVDDTSNR